MIERFSRDTGFILHQRDLEERVSLRKKHSVSGEKEGDQARALFSQLSKHMVRALHDKYRLDFEMFGYDIVKFIKFASESEGFLPDVIAPPDRAEEEERREEEEEEDMETDTVSISATSNSILEP